MRNKNIKDHLLFLLSDRVREIPSEGRVNQFETTRSWMEERTFYIQQSDALIAIGGGKGTLDCVEKAFLSGKPVFVATTIPCPATKAWKRHKSSFNYYLVAGDADFLEDLNITPEEFCTEVFRIIDSFAEARYARFSAEEKEVSRSEHYIDFDLHIGPNGHAIARTPEGDATADISTKIPNAIQLSLNLIEKNETNEDLLKNVGRELYDWLFPGQIHTLLHQTEAVARIKNAKMRLRLRIEAETIASLPLEFLYRMQGGYFFAVNPNTVLARYLHLDLPAKRMRRPLHMLTIIADPTDQTRLNLDEWETIIQEALAGPLNSRYMTLQTVKRGTRKEIDNALSAHKPDIIQFVGHGIYQDKKGHIALVDEDTGKTWLVDDECFANLYMGYDDNLGLIILATCESAQSDNPQGFLGIAPKLVQRGVPSVVAMQYQVLIKTAKIFLEDFYTAVAARKPIDWATQHARNAVSQELGLGNREFATPVLYMRAQNGNVFC
jgi:CHAT domain-containing protein